ncbi:MAG: peptidoglycan DD-metalloendopeptidase family protein [Prevotellaceae bacterium]|jgi:murein DD-endopeptidase MepM/ murein hydrolase activator NlpD|nr:peptidoglycan DD-metalloendopeptidase family protein [Prevotellaceae bacterium]
MAKKFKFNHETLDFDEVRSTVLGIVRQGVLWMIVGALFLVGYYALFAQFFSTPQEQRLAEVNRTLSDTYQELIEQHEQIQTLVDYLEQRDADIYLHIFEAESPSLSAAEKEQNLTDIEHIDNITLTRQTKNGIDRLDSIISKQTVRLRSLVEQAQGNPSLQFMPASQPVSNNDLRRIAATYGMRIHPFYKVFKMHSGIDFTAPPGTNVYATGNAVVESVHNSLRGTGLTVTLNHNNGYRTTYAHLLKANVSQGARVKRGDVIGLVGNSGRSTAPHLHYEVHKNNHTVNPIHYFFKDITPEDYQMLIHIASSKGQSFD